MTIREHSKKEWSFQEKRMNKSNQKVYSTEEEKITHFNKITFPLAVQVLDLKYT